MTNDLSGAPAPTPLEKKRFLVLSLLRITGAALVFLGVLIVGGKIDLPVLVGWAFMLLGLYDLLIMPRFLARRWRTPPP
jgi:hypothetical protein